MRLYVRCLPGWIAAGLLTFCSLATGSATAAVPADDAAAIARDYIPRLEKNLKENILAFWLPRCLDHKNGGYTIAFGPAGEARPDSAKMIVTQARMVWLFSRLAREGYGGKELLDAADHGYRFLRDKMWDQQHGGFYWEVDAAGNRQLRPAKHLYGQSFALYALSEYYLASHRPDVLNFTTRFFNLLEEKSHDNTYGGYNESFQRDWTPQPAGETSYMGAPAGLKLMNTHLHLLESMTAFYRASRMPLARDRVAELITIESNAVVRKNLSACTDKYRRNWEPVLDGEFARVSYGHDIENIWLLADAAEAIGQSAFPMLDFFRISFAYSMKYGWDAEKGGFFHFGEFNQPATNREKNWWVQSEAIVSSLYMYRLTHDAKYLDVFRRTYDFIERYQTDWKTGEWFETVDEQGRGRGDKAHAWKAGYHNGRAMIECLRLLRGFRE